jgi:hypothetical protein
MSLGNKNSIGSTTAKGPLACPVCDGPMSPHEETVIRLGHPDEVRHRYRCVNPGCGASMLADGPESQVHR